MKKILLLLLALGIAGGAYYYYSSKKSSDQPSFLTENVKRADVEKTVVASGSVRSNHRVEVGAQVSGEITKIYVKLGQEVKKGELIAEIDSKTQKNSQSTKKAQLASYIAQLRAKETAYSTALKNYNRQSKLFKTGSTSRVNLDSAKSTLDSAKSEVTAIKQSIKQTEIELDTAKTNVGYTKITSPMNGTVISIPVSEGQTVNANQNTPTIVQIADLKTMLIKPEISEGDITKVKAGQEVEFTILSAPDKKYHAVIDSVDPASTTLTDDEYSESVSNTSAVYYYANVVVDNSDNTLRIGMTTEDSIKIASAKNVLTISNMALKKERGKYFVNVLNAENKMEAKQVEIGVQNDFQTEIKSGLNEGDKIVISEVKAGEKVGNTRIPGGKMF